MTDPHRWEGYLVAEVVEGQRQRLEGQDYTLAVLCWRVVDAASLHAGCGVQGYVRCRGRRTSVNGHDICQTPSRN